MIDDRYSRQQLFAPIGKSGQQKLAQKHVLIVGAGALGTSSSEAMVRAGVGRVTIVDRDYVEWSNLQRQQLFSEEDARKRMPKAIAATERLKQINSSIDIQGHIMDVGPEEMEALVEDVDLILDASDNFDIRLIINDVAQKHNIPWIYGAVVGSYGLSCAFLPGKTPCFSCLLETVPMGGATCDTVGVISPTVQMVVSLQVSEALKLLVEDEAALSGKLVSFDLWSNQYSAIRVQRLKKKDCPSCGENRTYPYLSPSNLTRTAVLCGRDTVQIRPAGNIQRSLDELEEQLAKMGTKTERNPYLLSFTVDHRRMVVFQDGRVLVHGTKEVSEARSLYHRYFG